MYVDISVFFLLYGFIFVYRYEKYKKKIILKFYWLMLCWSEKIVW